MSLENLPPLDIATFINTAMVLIIFIGMFVFWRGVQGIRDSMSINFIRVRRARVAAGWRMMFLGFFLAAIGLLLKVYGEPMAYRYIPVTPTPTITPTAIPLPSITPTPPGTSVSAITLTPAESFASSGTQTPHIPMVVEVMFEGLVTPPADAIFSPLTFSRGLDADYNPRDPGTEFANPVGHLYASFSYDKMLPGVQWTALWYREVELVHFETMVWEPEWGTGGYGFTDWDPDPAEWLPGNYFVQVFAGHVPKKTGNFVVTGAQPTETLSPIQPTVPILATYTSTATPVE
jgi:hypothetical protein